MNAIIAVLAPWLVALAAFVLALVFLAFFIESTVAIIIVGVAFVAFMGLRTST